jgi:hypothetical protein
MGETVADRHGMTSLHLAAQEHHAEVARLLLDAGAAVDAADEHGNRPLWKPVFASKGKGRSLSFAQPGGAHCCEQPRHQCSSSRNGSATTTSCGTSLTSSSSQRTGSLLCSAARCDRAQDTHRTRVAVVVLIALADCGGKSLASPSPASVGSGRWTRSDLRPVTQPAGIDGRFILYAAGAGGLRVVALDSRSEIDRLVSRGIAFRDRSGRGSFSCAG